MFKKILREFLLLFILFLIIILAVAIYKAPCAPSKFPVHWNAAGQIDGWGSKTFVVLFFPLMAMGFYFLMMLFPKIDPLKKNYPSFEGAYYIIRLWLMVFLGLIFVLTFLAGWGFKINPGPPMIVLISLLMIVLGFALPKVKQNYFFGIRTPWALHSENNWNKTHQWASKIFVLGGLLAMLAVFLPVPSNFWAFIIIILLAALAPVVYSYLIFRQKGD
jgi:uncharacterized membrane protein